MNLHTANGTMLGSMSGWHCTEKANTIDGDFLYRFKLETLVLLNFFLACSS